jgi:hypothetical protein
MPPGDDDSGTQIARFGAAYGSHIGNQAAEQIGGYVRATVVPRAWFAALISLQ